MIHELLGNPTLLLASFGAGMSSVAAVGTALVGFVLHRAMKGADVPSQPPPGLPPLRQPGADMSAMLETILVKGTENQLAVFDKMNQLAAENVRLSMEGWVKQGQKLGGRMRQKTGTRKANGQMAAACRLCQNPSITDPMASEIVAHSTHHVAQKKRGEQLNLMPASPTPAAERVFDATDQHVQTDGAGTEFIECADCQVPVGTYVGPDGVVHHEH